ncbi:MAG: thiol peroxidase [Planctomycetaceae bacterium]
MPKVTLKGNPVNVTGTELKAGQKAPDFKLQKNDMSDYTLASGKGKVRILAAMPSLDTGVCDAETRRFNQEAAKFPNVEIVAVSMDLPMAQKRWCGAAGVDKVTTASDHRDASFGKAYGCLVAGGPLDRFLCRAVFVVGPENEIRHVQYVPEISTEPDYAKVLAALK